MKDIPAKKVLKVDEIDLSTWEAVVKTVKTSRPNLGRILERKAKLVNFDKDNKYIKVHIPSGGLREPKEILTDFISEVTKLSSENWKIELPLMAEIDTNMQTLYQKQVTDKAELINKVKEHSIIKKILNDLVEAEIIDVIKS